MLVVSLNSVADGRHRRADVAGPRAAGGVGVHVADEPAGTDVERGVGDGHGLLPRLVHHAARRPLAAGAALAARAGAQRRRRRAQRLHDAHQHPPQPQLQLPQAAQHHRSRRPPLPARPTAARRESPPFLFSSPPLFGQKTKQ